MNEDSPKAGPPDLDLIQMVQAARLAHDADVLPSQVHAVYWLEVKREGPGPAPTSRAGAWVIETTAAQADALWIAIRAATRSGQLGYKSKTTTSARAGGLDRDQREIHVLTFDADDTADVERVRTALEQIGITESLRYVRSHEPG